MKKINYLLVFIVLFVSCGNSEKDLNNSQVNDSDSSINKSLNITILLDLSDRLIRNVNPSQEIRDLAIVNEFVKQIKNNMEIQGAYAANDKIQVLFKPIPEDPNINTISKNLSIDLEGLKPGQKKEIYDNIEKRFEDNLKLIYESTLKTKNWIGSDIWRFFKNDVKDLAIKDGESYRNILVILTDGYIYHENSILKINNKTTYLTNSYLRNIGVYSKTEWREFLQENNYGLLNTENSLNQLEVLFLEINPMESHIIDEEIIRWYLGNWMNDMEISNFRIYNTDVSTNTVTRIENFLSN